ncbi:MAG: TlpA disulfide reductase family protein [Wenzhouxiangellaceae bacterium]|nr:TlpA disulfide reductase family protein [Wenzhouxiangellaceae bacterium]
MKRVLVVVLVAAAGLGLGVLAAWMTRGDAPPAPGPATVAQAREGVRGVGEPIPEFEHAGLDGRIWTAGDLVGRPTLVNFWATWCKPCLREMPLLERWSEELGDRMRIVGVAIDDPGRAAGFVDEVGVSYPVLVGTSDVMDTQRRFGNPEGLLPYTVLVDASGTILWQHLGELTEADLATEILPLIEPSAEGSTASIR